MDFGNSRSTVELLTLVLTHCLLSFYFTTDVTHGAASITGIRLADGSGNGRDGRVEILYNGVWGTICDDGWTVNDSTVACRMLGFSSPSRAVNGSTLYPPGPTTLPVLLRVIQCYGSEQTLSDCPFQLNNNLCQHRQDAGVICLGDVILTTTTTTARPSTTTLPPTICSTPSNAVRLVTGLNSTNPAEGRVQIYHNNVWGEICSDLWGVQDAQVVCRMLCYNPANARAVIGAVAYGNASYNFWLSQVQCNGTETDINTCPHSTYGSAPGCDVIHTAGVSCKLDTPTLPPLPDPEISCVGEMITALFARSSDPNLLPDHLTVAAPDGLSFNCYYTRALNASFVSISIPFIGNCSTGRQVNGTHVSYNNTVRYAVPPSTIISRTQVYYIKVSCVLPKASDPGNGFDPEGRTVPPQPGDGKFDIKLMFFEDGRFQTPLGSSTNAPLKVTLGDWLYIGAQLYTADPSMKVVLSDCYVSPSVQSDVLPHYQLVTNKCAVESTVTLYAINSTLSGFRFQSFRFVNTSSTSMYIHCATFACALTDTTGSCDPVCRGTPTGRRRRSDVTSGLLYDVSSSLFVVVLPGGEEGVMTSRRPVTRPLDTASSCQPVTPRHVTAVTCLLTSLLLLL